MIKQNQPKSLKARFRLKNALLFNCLTMAFLAFAIAGTYGCRPFSNDVSPDVAPGTEKAYDTSLAAGSIAHEILSSKSFPALLVEIQAVRGFAPSQEAMDQLQAFLIKYAKKPKGIEIVVDPPIAPQTQSGPNGGYSLNDLKQIETKNRRHYTTKGKLALYALFLDGNISGDVPTDRILGRAYQSQSVAIFMNSIRSATQATSQPAAHPTYAETTVLLHEFGHLLGIVSMDDVQRPHADLVHHSCTNAKCLMNRAAESGAQIGTFTADQIPALDDDCENDLKALRD